MRVLIFQLLLSTVGLSFFYAKAVVYKIYNVLGERGRVDSDLESDSGCDDGIAEMNCNIDIMKNNMTVQIDELRISREQKEQKKQLLLSAIDALIAVQRRLPEKQRRLYVAQVVGCPDEDMIGVFAVRMEHIGSKSKMTINSFVIDTYRWMTSLQRSVMHTHILWQLPTPPRNWMTYTEVEPPMMRLVDRSSAASSSVPAVAAVTILPPQVATPQIMSARVAGAAVANANVTSAPAVSSASTVKTSVRRDSFTTLLNLEHYGGADSYAGVI